MKTRIGTLTVAMVLPVMMMIARAETPGKTLLKTIDGQPDLQGVWVNPTLTPFERPASFADKAKLSKLEMTELEKKARANQVDRAPTPGDPGTYNQAWSDGGTKVRQRRPSLQTEHTTRRLPASSPPPIDLARIRLT